MKFKKCLFQEIGNPYPLKANAGKSFQGSIVLGKGFVLSPEEAEKLIKKDPRNKDVLFPYLNGDDLNNHPEQKPSRWVINFFDWSEERARVYTDCFEIVERLVKPERLKQNDKGGIEKWWQFLRPRGELYRIISQLDQVMVVAQVSKTLAFSFVPKAQVISMMCVVFAFDDYFHFSLMQNTLHKEWVQKYASALKADTRYTPSDVFETYPFLNQLPDTTREQLSYIGQEYDQLRQNILRKIQVGLTKLYNQFHNQKLTLVNSDDDKLSAVDFEKKHGKDCLWLKNHLQKLSDNINYNEVVNAITSLRLLHVKMDQAILETYEWTDIQLNHNFYEMEYLSENDRTRFTIHPTSRKEILKRLLKLNHSLSNKSEKRKESSDKSVQNISIVDLFTYNF